MLWKKLSELRPEIGSMILLRSIDSHDKFENYALANAVEFKGVPILVSNAGQLINEEHALEFITLWFKFPPPGMSTTKDRNLVERGGKPFYITLFFLISYKLSCRAFRDVLILFLLS